MRHFVKLLGSTLYWVVASSWYVFCMTGLVVLTFITAFWYGTLSCLRPSMEREYNDRAMHEEDNLMYSFIQKTKIVFRTMKQQDIYEKVALEELIG